MILKTGNNQEPAAMLNDIFQLFAAALFIIAVCLIGTATLPDSTPANPFDAAARALNR
jgi:hypothetical protein